MAIRGPSTRGNKRVVQRASINGPMFRAEGEAMIRVAMRKFGVWACLLLVAVLALTGCAAGAPQIVAPVVLTPLPADDGNVAQLVAETPTPIAETALAIATLPPGAVVGVTDAPVNAIAADGAAPTLIPAAPVDPNAVAGATIPPAVVDPGFAAVAPASPAAGNGSSQTAPAIAAGGDETTSGTLESAQEVEPRSEPTLVPASDDAAAQAEAAGVQSTDPGTEGLLLPDNPNASGSSLLVESGANGRKEVAFTFDAGADLGYTPELLDYLRDEGIPATFGMTGVFAEENPAMVVRMANEGHQIINHTYDHSSLTGANTNMPAMTEDELAGQLQRTEEIVQTAIGDPNYTMKPYFRPPYGDYDGTTLPWLTDLGYPLTIMWTCDTHGWALWTSDQIFDYCTQVPLEDEIVLMHVGAAAITDFETLPRLVDYYRQRGYAFVTVAQMLQP